MSDKYTIISENGECYRYEPREYAVKEGCVGSVFQFGKQVWGVYYAENPEDINLPTPLFIKLADYDDMLLSATSVHDFEDWRENWMDDEPEYHFMNNDEGNALLMLDDDADHMDRWRLNRISDTLNNCPV